MNKNLSLKLCYILIEKTDTKATDKVNNIIWWEVYNKTEKILDNICDEIIFKIEDTLIEASERRKPINKIIVVKL
jgi:hypothetical protein